MDAMQHSAPFEDEPAIVAALVAEVDAASKASAASQARMLRALAKADAHAASRSVGRVAKEREMATRSMAAELTPALRVSDRSVQRQMDVAATIVQSYPLALSALERGAITRGHVYVITECGAELSDDTRAAFDAAAVSVCERLFPAQARPVLQRIVLRLHPRTLAERYADARERRAVTIRDLPEGLAELTLTDSATVVHAVHDRLTRQARALKQHRDIAGDGDGSASEDTRTMDQLRADLAADMLLASAPTIDTAGPTGLDAIHAIVQVTVPVTTLTGTGCDPAMLAGTIPIDPDTANRLAGGVTAWERVLTHPITGAVLTVDTYRPNADLRRHLRARDQHCRFPGCRMPAIRSDIDHTIDAQYGGPTTVSNLAHVCRRHHSLKHWNQNGRTAWRVVQLANGSLRWTTPHGVTLTDEPPAVGPPGVHFTPEPEPPPPF